MATYMADDIEDRIRAAGLPFPELCRSVEVHFVAGNAVEVVYRCFASAELLRAVPPHEREGD